MTSFILGVFELTVGMSAFIALLLLTLKLFGKKFTAKCRYILWTLVVIRLAIPFSFGLMPSLIEIPIEPDLLQIEDASGTLAEDMDPLTQNSALSVPDGNTAGSDIQAVYPNVNPDHTSALPSETDITPLPEEPAQNDTAAKPIAWNHILGIAGIIYFAGAAVFLVWVLGAYFVYTGKLLKSAKEADNRTMSIYRAVCKKYGIKKLPTLLVAYGIHSPAAFGLFHRRIVLPDIEFTDNGLVGTLAHEVTHCRRGDLYVKFAALLARSLGWFNPLVHIAAMKCEMEMELSCDEAVLSGCSDEARSAYGEVMLDIIRRCRRNRGLLTTHFNPHKNAVAARIKNIIYGSGKRRGRILISVCLVLCVLAGTFVACQTGADISDDIGYAEGIYIKDIIGADMVLIDGTSPCTFWGADGVVIEGLTDGDRIRIGVREFLDSSPMQVEIYSIEKLSDGTIDDIDPAVLESLRELGWIENDIAIDKEYTDLLSLTAKEIRQKYGELTLTYLENGGTPIVAVGTFEGIYLVYHDLMAPDFPNLYVPDDMIANEVIFNYQYVNNPAFSGEICGLRLETDIAEAEIAWEDAEFHFINGSMFLSSSIGEYLLTAVVGATGDPRMPSELTATDEDWSVWEEEFAKSPCGKVVQIRLAYAVGGEANDPEKPDTFTLDHGLSVGAVWEQVLQYGDEGGSCIDGNTIYVGEDGVRYFVFGNKESEKSRDYIAYRTYKTSTVDGDTVLNAADSNPFLSFWSTMTTPCQSIPNGKYAAKAMVDGILYVYKITVNGNEITIQCGRDNTGDGGGYEGTYTFDRITGEMSISLTAVSGYEADGNVTRVNVGTVKGKLLSNGALVGFVCTEPAGVKVPTDFPLVFIKGTGKPVPNADSITSLEDYKQLGPDFYECYYEYTRALLTGDTAKMEELSMYPAGTFDGYKGVHFTFKSITREAETGRFILTADVSEGHEVLPSGTQRFYYCEYPRRALEPILEPSAPNATEASAELSKLLNMTMKYNLDEMEVTEYIIDSLYRKTGKASFTEGEIVGYAKRCFGVEAFTPNQHFMTDGAYTSLAHGGNHIYHDIIGTNYASDSGISTVTVRFYADYAKTVYSHLIEYQMKKLDGDFVFIGQKMIDERSLRPFTHAT